MTTTLIKELKMEFTQIKDYVDEKSKNTSVELEGINSKLGEMEASFSDLKKNVSRGGISVPGVEEELKRKQFSFAKMFKGIAFEKENADLAWKNAGYERDIIKETMKQRALVEGTDTAGGYLVPMEVLEGEFIDLLRDALVFPKLGVRELRGLTGSPVQLAGQSGGAQAFWLGETEAVTASQQTFDIKDMTPRRLGCLTKMSNRLIALADKNVDQMVRQDLTAVMARAFEAAVLYAIGNGNSNKRPRALINTPGIQSHVIQNPNGGVLDYDDLDAMMGLIEDANADQLGTPKVLMHNRVKRRLKRLKVANYAGQATEQPYLSGQPPMTDATLAGMMGYEFHTTNQCPTNLVKGASNNLSYVIMAIWNEMITGFWRNLVFRASNTAGDANGSAFTQDQTWMLAFMDVDALLRYPEAFVVAADALA